MKTKPIKVGGRDIEIREDGMVIVCAFTDAANRKLKRNETMGYRRTDGYRIVSFSLGGKVKLHQVHRLVARAFLPTWDDSLQVDHIDGNPSNNRVENLRMVTVQGNGMAKRENQGVCKFRGVGLSDSKINPYVSKIKKDGRTRYIGYFPTAEQAARAWDKVAIGLGFYPEALNFPLEYS